MPNNGIVSIGVTWSFGIHDKVSRLLELQWLCIGRQLGDTYYLTIAGAVLHICTSEVGNCKSGRRIAPCARFSLL
ncbi:unnamed protein product [Allacma fusca]|uniref:Uncharacterized protein n=1 Tax=Allacma fusca TaxID=39272 RepID=A0A8J2LRP1_9HEXA|nr:unnamed protein product [Allacma fusca]